MLQESAPTLSGSSPSLMAEGDQEAEAEGNIHMITNYNQSIRIFFLLISQTTLFLLKMLLIHGVCWLSQLNIC